MTTKRNYTHDQTTVVQGWGDFCERVRVRIDLDALAYRLALRASHSKHGISTAFEGIVKAEILRAKAEGGGK